MINISPRELGRLGETIVTSLLPDSIDVNENGETHLPYDILWNNIKIDVKTRRSKNEFIDCQVKANTLNQGVILVFLLIKDDRYYFWVDRYADKLSSRRHTSNSVNSFELISEIEKWLLIAEPIITVNQKLMTVGISKELDAHLLRLIDLTAEKENVSAKSIQRPLLLEKMANVYEKYLEDL